MCKIHKMRKMRKILREEKQLCAQITITITTKTTSILMSLSIAIIIMHMCTIQRKKSARLIDSPEL